MTLITIKDNIQELYSKLYKIIIIIDHDYINNK